MVEGAGPAEPVVVVEHDPGWAEVFTGLRRAYAEALGAAGAAYLSIEHVGSTSVPGLAAKPVIDCDIVVPDDGHGPGAAGAALTGLGFEARGDLGVPLRWAFREPAGWPRTNTYVVVTGSLSLRNHLAVRDVLRRVPALREEYAALKVRLAGSDLDVDVYTSAKTDVLERVLRAGGFDEADIAEIAALNR